MNENEYKETHKVVYDDTVVKYFDDLQNAGAYAEKNKLHITSVEVVTVDKSWVEDMISIQKMSREKQAIEFMKEYQKLCEKFNMELAKCDAWGDGFQEIEVFDKESGLFHLHILD